MRSTLEAILRAAGGHPGRPSGPPRSYTLPLESIQPIIRIAHHFDGRLNVAERYIYDFELVLITRGQSELRYGDGHTQHVGEHELVWLRPFEVHSFRSPRHLSVAYIAVHFDLAPQCPPPRSSSSLADRSPYMVTLAEGIAMPSHVALTPDDGIACRLRSIVDLWNVGSPVDRLCARVDLEYVLCSLIRLSQQAGYSSDPPHPSALRNRSRMEQAVERIRNDFDKPLTVGELASTVGMSETHFTRVFRALLTGPWVICGRGGWGGGRRG